MASEVRVNQIQNRSGLGTITVADSGVVISGITTISDLRTSGNTGIGTTNPLTKVHIQGTGNGSSGSTGLSDSSSASALLLKPTIGSGTALALGTRATGGHYIQGLYAASSVDSVRDIQINPYGGSVGIGTFADAFGGVPGNSTFVVATTGLERLRIDSSGRMTLPYQPSFHATGSAGGISFSGNLKIPYDTEYFDVGGNYDQANYRFTAPVAGKYFFYASYLTFPNADPAYVTMVIAKNGTTSYGNGFKRATNSAQEDRNLSTILDLAQNDYIEVYAEAGGTSYYYTASGHAHFFGYLIG